MSIARIRTVAYAIVFGGWAVPALAARLAPARMGPGAGDEVARLFNIISGGWVLLAGAYAALLAVRMRRDLGA